MRCKNIEISLKIPVPINGEDENGNIYAEAAVSAACEKVSGQPLVQLNSENIAVPIGVAQKAEYSDGYILVNGIIWHGGSCESVSHDKSGKIITEMTIVNFGLCQ